MVMGIVLVVGPQFAAFHENKENMELAANWQALRAAAFAQAVLHENTENMEPVGMQLAGFVDTRLYPQKHSEGLRYSLHRSVSFSAVHLCTRC